MTNIRSSGSGEKLYQPIYNQLMPLQAPCEDGRDRVSALTVQKWELDDSRPLTLPHFVGFSRSKAAQLASQVQLHGLSGVDLRLCSSAVVLIVALWERDSLHGLRVVIPRMRDRTTQHSRSSGYKSRPKSRLVL